MPRFAIVAVSFCLGLASGAEPLVIHHSGTFTVLQDDVGSIGGLNTDEANFFAPLAVAEPSPLVGVKRLGDLASRYVSSVPRPALTTTMVLERSVLHVHLPPGESTATFDISVKFSHGLLTRFHPDADVWINGQQQPRGPHYAIHPPWPREDTVSSLTWSKVRAGSVGEQISSVPASQVLPTVAAALLTVGEQRHYALSYRGLGHLDPPVRAFHVYPRDYGLVVHPRPEELWLVDVRDNGTAAVRRVKKLTVDHDGIDFVNDQFAETDYDTAAIPTLLQELYAAVITDGLFADEAQNLLQASNISHVTFPGRRLLFLAPQTWIAEQLPVTITRETRIVRSFVGCIELVTDAQRAALAKIAAGPVSQPGWYYDLIRRELTVAQDGKPAWQPDSADRIQALFAGEAGVLQRLQVEVPEDYAAYLSLGRFRDALLAHYQQRNYDPEIGQFCDTYLVSQVSAMVHAAAEGNGRVKLKPPEQRSDTLAPVSK